MVKLTPDELKRFWDSVEKGEDSECWPTKTANFTLKGKTYRKRRILYWIEKGFNPERYIKPTCGNSDCLNPKHIADVLEIKKERPDPTNEEIHRLKGKISLLEDDLKHAQRAITITDKKVSLFEMLADHTKNLIIPFQPPKTIELESSAINDNKIIEEHLVMHLSDEHADETIVPHQVGGLENYNFLVACARAENYVDTTIKFARQTLTNYHFPVLWILAYGDHTSGEIHKSVDRSYYRNQLRNCLAIGQLHAFMIRDLSAYFKEINVLYLPGNHGRRNIFVKKDYNNPWDSWDFLIGEIARLHCTQLPGVKFLIPEAFNVILDINGYGFHVQHGDDIPAFNSLPWYGIERQTRRLAALHNMQGKRVQYHVMGHFHKPADLGDLDGETIINGPWPGTNPYSFGKFTGYTEPSQWIHGVHEKYGISWRLKVKLRKPEVSLGEEKPSRYLVQLSNPETGEV